LGDFAFDKEGAALRLDFNTEDADLVLMNLETPFPIHLKARPKAGPNLAGNFAALTKVRTRNFVLTLANNHIMDYGLSGLKSTLELLNKKGFMVCGAGKDVHDARQPIVVGGKGVQVGIIACCEAQFGVARQNQSGVAEFGPWVYQLIRDLCQTVDAVIVSVHAAVEDSPWPSPYIRELYQSFIDTGATVVHGHHAHVPQGYEAYGDGVIFYGMGNFAVDPDKWRDYPNGMWSLAAEIDFSSKPVCWRPLTLEIRHQPGSEAIVIEESNGDEQANHRRYLEICNRPFDNPDLFEALWQEVALRAYYHHGAEYMRFDAFPRQHGRLKQARSGLSMLKSALLKRIDPSRPSQYDYLLWYHMIACESHRQMLVTALGILAGEIKDMRTEETRTLADEMMPWSRKVIPV
jgi:poly-gamma-glutamate synthesis protein (capsule biosynthesis protein)